MLCFEWNKPYISMWSDLSTYSIGPSRWWLWSVQKDDSLTCSCCITVSLQKCCNVKWLHCLIYRDSAWSADFRFGADYSPAIKRVMMTFTCFVYYALIITAQVHGSIIINILLEELIVCLPNYYGNTSQLIEYTAR